MSLRGSDLISSSQAQEYEENGAICLRDVFDRHWLDIAERGIDANKRSPSQYAEALRGSRGGGIYFDDYCNWSRIPDLRDYVFNSPAAKIAGILMKSKFSTFYHEHVLTKEPGTTKITPWHQDQAYYPIDGFQVCSIWMPIDPVSKETTIKFVKGSHKWGTWFIPKKFQTEKNYAISNHTVTNRQYEIVPDIDSNLDKYELLYWDLQPGDCIVFHMMTLHGAPENTSNTKHRRVLSTRWLGEDAVMAPRPWITSPPIDGHLAFGEPPHKSDIFPIVWKNR